MSDEKQAKSTAVKKKTVWDDMDVPIIHEGRQITLPADPKEMSLEEGISVLTRLNEQDQMKIAVHEVVEACILDGARALRLALRETFGWDQPVPKPSFFGPIAPNFMTLEVGYGQTEQVIWGRFGLPNLDAESYIETGIHEQNGQMLFAINGAVKKKFAKDIKRLADLTRKIAREQSVYRGKAIRLPIDDEGELVMDFQHPIRFIDLSKADPMELIFSAITQEQVQTNLWNPIEHTEFCRTLNIPLKRGVLLEGPYGCGKTLTAYVTARKCEENGWTFCLVERVTALEDALKFARLYQPAVVFCEDIDKAVSGERTVEMDAILNIVDGAEAKSSELIVILTTNAVEKINKALLRPGRLDAVISVTAPDAAACDKLMRHYARGLIHAGSKLPESSKLLAGKIPAVIREVVERSKLAALSRPGFDISAVELTDQDLAIAARGMEMHLELLDGRKEKKSPTAGERIEAALHDIVHHGATGDTPVPQGSATALAADTNRRVRKVQAAVDA